MEGKTRQNGGKEGRRQARKTRTDFLELITWR